MCEVLKKYFKYTQKNNIYKYIVVMLKHFYNFNFFLLAMLTNTNYYLFCQDCRCCC